MVNVGRNDQPTRGHFIANLSRREVLLPLCHRRHLGGDRTEPSMLQLSHRLEALRSHGPNRLLAPVVTPAPFRVRFDTPPFRKKVPSGFT